MPQASAVGAGGVAVGPTTAVGAGVSHPLSTTALLPPPGAPIPAEDDPCCATPMGLLKQVKQVLHLPAAINQSILGPEVK